MAMKNWIYAALLCLATVMSLPLQAKSADPMDFANRQIAAHPGKSGMYVLDTAVEALRARAWLVEHAERSIEVQYFIWSSDNVGTLAADALLRAADRGVRVRVIVDDLLVDAPDKILLALARHPRITIKIYNPKNSVGATLHKRAWNVYSDFRGVNQRMHNKTFIVDGKVGITGGRNMAAEYFDYNHEYNFRDRDALLVGEVVKSMRGSFEKFWGSKLSVPVGELYNGFGLMKKNVQVEEAEVNNIYRDLHAYAKSPENFAPEVRAAINSTPTSFARLEKEVVWGNVEYISDLPGKNSSRGSLGGGGLSSNVLAKMVEGARKQIVIQSPYLILSEPAMRLFRRTIARGVRIRISTNSLASTDNIPAFSGYRNQREELLKMGLEIHEYRPDAITQRQLMAQSLSKKSKMPITALHAKTMVVDSKTVFIGTYNLDPRSENLNTEGGVIIHSEVIGQAVQSAIELDMQKGNSWNAASDDPDQYVPLAKRSKVRALQAMPLQPLL